MTHTATASPPQFDAIADAYQAAMAEARPDNLYVFEPTMVKHLGCLKDKFVLDVGCGNGKYTELAYQLRPAGIVGIDVSEAQIRLARQSVKMRGYRVRLVYRVADIRDYVTLGGFDVVMAAYLLHYAQTERELEAMCQNIFACTAPGGRFIALNNNPRRPLKESAEFGVSSRLLPLRRPRQPGQQRLLRGGAPMELCLYANDGSPAVRFVNYYWPEATYERALRRAGFRSVEWHEVEVSDAGRQMFPPEYWERFLATTQIAVLECRR